MDEVKWVATSRSEEWFTDVDGKVSKHTNIQYVNKEMIDENKETAEDGKENS
uniref:Uncharacterized protein n=1 Tax=viral metagenome TaxID=1070528 RepID=A0A6H1ZLL6_9ZZZZ